jgi:hypothetical protein
VIWFGFRRWFWLVFECRGLGSEASLRQSAGAAGRRGSVWPWPHWWPTPFGSAPPLPSACSAPRTGSRCTHHTACFSSVWFALLVMSCSFVDNLFPLMKNILYACLMVYIPKPWHDYYGHVPAIPWPMMFDGLKFSVAVYISLIDIGLQIVASYSRDANVTSVR